MPPTVDLSRFIFVQTRWREFYPLLEAYVDPEHYLQVLLGYWLPDERPAASAWLGVTIYSSPTASLRKETITALGRFLQNHADTWVGEELADDQARSCIFRGKALSHFMTGEDHVGAVKRYFKELLADVAELRATSPELPWGKAT